MFNNWKHDFSVLDIKYTIKKVNIVEFTGIIHVLQNGSTYNNMYLKLAYE